MNETIKEMLVGLGFQIDYAGLQKFTDGIASASLRTAAFGAAMVAAAGVIVKGVSDVASGYEELDLLAQKYNTTASEIDDFVDSAEMVGVGGEAAENALSSMNKVVGEAALGIGRGKAILDKLGIAAKDASGKVRPTTEVMGDLQAKLATMDRGQSMAIMEKLGLNPQLIRMFNGELGNIQKIQDEMSNNDASVGFNFDEAINESKKFQSSMIEMKTQGRLVMHWFQTLWDKLAVSVMPKVRGGIEKISRVFEDLRHNLQENGAKIVAVLQPIIETIIKIASAFISLAGRAIGIIISVFGKAFEVIGKVNDATNGWAGYIGAALVAWKLLNLGFLATPIGAVIGFSVALLALYDDFMTWKEGGESLFDWTAWANGAQLIIDAFTEVTGVFDGVVEAVRGLIDMITSLFNMDIQGFSDGFLQMGKGVIMSLQSIGSSVMNLVGGIGSLISTVLRLFGFDVDGFAKMFTGAFNAIVNVINKVKKAFGGVVDKIASFGGKFNGAFDSVFGDSVSAPSPQVRASVAGGANINQATTINVNGGANPQATAQAVVKAQSGVNQNMARNMRGATR